MGMRFHLKDRLIGIRRLAGPYCWDCGITLCKGGIEKIHISSDWHEACPKCGETWNPLDITTLDRKCIGVEQVYSFEWATNVFNLAPLFNEDEPIEDDEGHKYSMNAFSYLLTMCPIQLGDT